MPLSIWDYLRQRTRDAVLAGIEDALDIAEQGQTSGEDQRAAARLTARLSQFGGKQLGYTPEADQAADREAHQVEGIGLEMTARPDFPHISCEFRPLRPMSLTAYGAN
jgi:hypothetical protein